MNPVRKRRGGCWHSVVIGEHGSEWSLKLPGPQTLPGIAQRLTACWVPPEWGFAEGREVRAGGPGGRPQGRLQGPREAERVPGWWAGGPGRDQENQPRGLLARGFLGPSLSSRAEASVLGVRSSAGALLWVAAASRVCPGRPAAARVQHGRAAPAVRVQPRLLLLEDVPQPRGAEWPQVSPLQRPRAQGCPVCPQMGERVFSVCVRVPWRLGLCYRLL